jgi:hypothetical protein
MRRIALSCLVLALGCSAGLRELRRGELTDTVEAAGAVVRLVYPPSEAQAAKDVAAALPGALAIAQRWGPLSGPVTVRLHPDHESLEAAAGQDGFPWMRGWARFASVDLQSPRTWGLVASPDQAYVEEVLAHELTHCVMYQASGSEWSWAYKSIPLWFREGMASVTAGQAHRRDGLERLARFYARSGPLPARAGDAGGHGDPLSRPELLYRTEDRLVYSAAHHAFRFLLDRYGERRVREVLAGMRSGAHFERAFQQAIGIAPARFEDEFRRYVAWRGWGG